MDTELVSCVADYYTDKVRAHGATARGVDWNGEESQRLRFAQLAKLLPPEGEFSLLDFGCGYGALFDFLAQDHERLRYTGFDISPAMIAEARKRHPEISFIQAIEQLPDEVDYVLASGIFNVKLGFEESRWYDYLFKTLDEFNRVASGGFAFNCLTWYSDLERKRPDLYYPEPEALFKLCKSRYARNVALLHDYDLYEFTVIVRKS